jgi:molecular chaperone GrpE
MQDKKKKHHEHHEHAAPDIQDAQPEQREEIQEQVDETGKLKAEAAEANDKYLRLYAEMENYKKKVRKDKEEFLAYCNENLLYEMLPVIDSMEMALQHSATGNDEAQASLKQGVENTLREMLRTLEKFGLKQINSVGKPFDPAYHHAMSQVEKTDMEPEHIVEEMRSGYQYKDKVLRPSLVSVSKQQQENKD